MYLRFLRGTGNSTPAPRAPRTLQAGSTHARDARSEKRCACKSCATMMACTPRNAHSSSTARSILPLAPPARQAVRGIRDLRIRGTHESARIAHPRGVACGRAPSTGKQKVDGQRPSRSRVSARQLLLLCRLRRPSLQSPASLSHRFPTTPRRKHSRTRRPQRRHMRRARCREPAPSPFSTMFREDRKSLDRPPIQFPLVSTISLQNSLEFYSPPPIHQIESFSTPLPPTPPHLLLFPPHPSPLPPFSPPSLQPSLVCPSSCLPLSQDVQRLREQPGLATCNCRRPELCSRRLAETD